MVYMGYKVHACWPWCSKIYLGSVWSEEKIWCGGVQEESKAKVKSFTFKWYFGSLMLIWGQRPRHVISIGELWF